MPDIGVRAENLFHSSSDMLSQAKRALLQVDFLIVGGGIAGLACACALSRSGHRVRVLEQSAGLGERACGVRVPPNLTKILLEWGLKDQLSKVAQICRGSTFHSLETGEPIGYLEWNEDVMQETGASFLLMHHQDLYRMLFDLAFSAGAEIIFNTPVIAVVPSPDSQPHVVTKSGEKLYADVIVGADGNTSLVRDAVVGWEDEAVDSGLSIFSFTLPADVMRKDPELAAFPDSNEWPIWMGTSRSVLAYPVRCGKEYSVHVIWPDDEIKEKTSKESWDTAYSTDLLHLDDFDPRVQRMVKLSPTAIRTKFRQRKEVEDWFDESGRLILIGEAAHPLLPSTSHGCSLAVEDAVVLSGLFSRLRSWDQVPHLMEAFQDLRQTRCQKVAQSELSAGRLFWLPPGPERHARDEGMRQSWEHGHDDWDEGQLRAQLDSIFEVFGYNAREAAEDWWVNWGLLRERSRQETPGHDPINVGFDVVQVMTTPHTL